MTQQNEDRWTYNFIAVGIKPDERIKKELLNLFAPLLSDKERAEITVENETDRDGNPIWEVGLSIFDEIYVINNLKDVLELCKKAAHIAGVVTLTARLRSNTTTFVVCSGDYWSRNSKKIMGEWDSLDFYHKEMIGKAPFYIYEVEVRHDK